MPQWQLETGQVYVEKCDCCDELIDVHDGAVRDPNQKVIARYRAFLLRDSSSPARLGIELEPHALPQEHHKDRVVSMLVSEWEGKVGVSLPVIHGHDDDFAEVEGWEVLHNPAVSLAVRLAQFIAEKDRLVSAFIFKHKGDRCMN